MARIRSRRHLPGGQEARPCTRESSLALSGLIKDSAMRPPRLFASLFAVVAIGAACSSSEPSAPTAGDEPAITVVAQPTATFTDPAPTPTTEVPETPDPAEATDAWLSMWEGVAEIVTDPGSARSTIGAVAVDSVFDQLDTIYNPSVDSGVGNTPRVFDNNPVATEQVDGSVLIEDCMFETPKVGNATIWYSGTLLSTNGQWKVQSLTLTSEIGCVPSAMAEAAIGGYERYWDARGEFWDPANPEHPLVGETLTGDQLDLIETLLADHAQRGLALRGRAEDHPEVVEVRSQREIAILDCMLQDPGRGLFVVATGERLGDIPAVAQGQRDLTSAVMILDDGAWKVSDIQGQADVSCDIAPTAQGLPVV